MVLYGCVSHLFFPAPSLLRIFSFPTPVIFFIVCLGAACLKVVSRQQMHVCLIRLIFYVLYLLAEALLPLVYRRQDVFHPTYDGLFHLGPDGVYRGLYLFLAGPHCGLHFFLTTLHCCSHILLLGFHFFLAGFRLLFFWLASIFP
jgi:hypothetical protein